MSEGKTLYLYKEVPDWYYYQTNGKTFTENYIEQFNKRNSAKAIEAYKARRRKAEIDAEIEKQIEEEITEKVKAALDSLLEG